jgi:hypothetical protein
MLGTAADGEENQVGDGPQLLYIQDQDPKRVKQSQ